ncbi:MAG: hypothetical protein AB8B55_00045 [Mariniblastus sp.]
MEIHNHGNNLKAPFHKRSNSIAETPAESGVDQVKQVKPNGLLDKLESDGKVRERLLVEIKAKVQAGEYLTRAAAVATAEQILGE